MTGHWKYELHCVDGGWGWGKTGAKRFMCAPGTSEAEAEAYVKRNIPGGWNYRLIGETDEVYFLTARDHGPLYIPIEPEEL